MAQFQFVEFPVLTTPRLTLREMTLADDQDVFAIRSDYEVTKLNIGAAYVDIEQARSLIRGIGEGYEGKYELRWGITLTGEDRVIGMVGFNYINRVDRRASIGYDLNRDYWRQGIMREALAAVLRFGFIELNLNRIEADTSDDNEASALLLLSLGFAHEGTLREQFYDRDAFHGLMLFGLLRREWENR